MGWYTVGPEKDNVLVDLITGEPTIFKTLKEAEKARLDILPAYPDTKIWPVSKIIKKKQRKI